MLASPDLYARSTWEGRSLNQTTALFEAYLRNGGTGTRCPKVGIGFFYYASIQRSIRGAVALDNVHKGEILCEVKVQSLVSEFSVGNSSMMAVRWPREPRAAVVLHMLRETARERSPHMPYFMLVQTHETDGIPMLWPDDSPRWHSISPGLRELARNSRASVQSHYKAFVVPALGRFAAQLSDGLGCAGGVCSRSRLEQVYSYERFARLYAIMGARDWVLPMYGENRAFMAPVVDMMNVGQVGIRAEFSDRRHAFVVTATEPIKKGSELLFYYGSMCRETWINMYGFDLGSLRPCRPRKTGLKEPKSKLNRTSRQGAKSRRALRGRVSREA